MKSRREIDDMIADDNFQEAIDALSAMIENDGDNAELYFERGKLLWRINDRRNAINDILKAMELNPGSPAGQYLEHINSIMSFYDKDRYNP